LAQEEPLTTEELLADLYYRYDHALKAKQGYENARASLEKSAIACQKICRHYTERLAHEQPDLVAEIQDAYQNGERIKDAMQKGNRFPEYDPKKGTTYFAILSNVPADRRSLEMDNCLMHWKHFEELKAKIESLYPAPKHFWWNGPRLSGPNLYQDFGIVNGL
jgi:hypothetical protein